MLLYLAHASVAVLVKVDVRSVLCSDLWSVQTYCNSNTSDKLQIAHISVRQHPPQHQLGLGGPELC